MDLFSNKKINSNLFIFLFIAIISLKFIASEILPIFYEGETINYTISINLTKYLNFLTNNKSIIENKSIFENQEDLIGKKGGIVKGIMSEYISKKKEI